MLFEWGLKVRFTPIWWIISIPKIQCRNVTTLAALGIRRNTQEYFSRRFFIRFTCILIALIITMSPQLTTDDIFGIETFVSLAFSLFRFYQRSKLFLVRDSICWWTAVTIYLAEEVRHHIFHRKRCELSRNARRHETRKTRCGRCRIPVPLVSMCAIHLIKLTYSCGDLLGQKVHTTSDHTFSSRVFFGEWEKDRFINYFVELGTHKSGEILLRSMLFRLFRSAANEEREDSQHRVMNGMRRDERRRKS